MSVAATKPCTSLADLAARLRSTDLIPSQQPLLDHLDERFGQLTAAGILSVTDLRERLPDRRSATALAADTGVDEDYLALLGRALRGYFPRPTRLSEFDWIEPEAITALRRVGISTSEHLRSAGDDVEGLASLTGVDIATLTELLVVADLVRVQWVGSTVARTLVAAGFNRPADVAAADPGRLTRLLAEANRDRRFFDATIGERDICRMVDAAGYVE